MCPLLGPIVYPVLGRVVFPFFVYTLFGPDEWSQKLSMRNVRKGSKFASGSTYVAAVRTKGQKWFLYIIGLHKRQVTAASRKQGTFSYLEKCDRRGNNNNSFSFSVHTLEHKHMHRNSSYLLSYIPIAGGSVLGGAHFWATHSVFVFP